MSAKKMEYQFSISRIIKESQDLPFDLVKDILLSLIELQDDKIEEYHLAILNQ